MKVLVTGAHGFIGSHTCDHLLSRGYEVRGLVSPWGDTRNLEQSLDHPAFGVVRADISEAESVRGVCEGCDAVIHAAARVADWGPWAAFERVNVRGTEHLLGDARARGVNRFVLVSSVAVHRYSGFRDADPVTLPRDNTENPYARSKILAEDAVLGRKDIEGLVIRPGLWPFGPRDPNFRRVVTALKRGLLPLVGSGDTVINTAYIGNLVIGLEKALQAQAKQASYVIADEGRPSWNDVFGCLAGLLGVAAPRVHLPPGGVVPVARAAEGLWRRVAPGTEPPLTRYRAELMLEDVHFSPESAQGDLGYAPAYTWREGLAASVARLEQATRQ